VREGGKYIFAAIVVTERENEVLKSEEWLARVVVMECLRVGNRALLACCSYHFPLYFVRKNYIIYIFFIPSDFSLFFFLDNSLQIKYRKKKKFLSTKYFKIQTRATSFQVLSKIRGTK